MYYSEEFESSGSIYGMENGGQNDLTGRNVGMNKHMQHQGVPVFMPPPMSSINGSSAYHAPPMPPQGTSHQHGLPGVPSIRGSSEISMHLQGVNPTSMSHLGPSVYYPSQQSGSTTSGSNTSSTPHHPPAGFGNNVNSIQNQQVHASMPISAPSSQPPGQNAPVNSQHTSLGSLHQQNRNTMHNTKNGQTSAVHSQQGPAPLSGAGSTANSQAQSNPQQPSSWILPNTLSGGQTKMHMGGMMPTMNMMQGNPNMLPSMMQNMVPSNQGGIHNVNNSGLGNLGPINQNNTSIGFNSTSSISSNSSGGNNNNNSLQSVSGPTALSAVNNTPSYFPQQQGNSGNQSQQLQTYSPKPSQNGPNSNGPNAQSAWNRSLLQLNSGPNNGMQSNTSISSNLDPSISASRKSPVPSSPSKYSVNNSNNSLNTGSSLSSSSLSSSSSSLSANAPSYVPSGKNPSYSSVVGSGASNSSSSSSFYWPGNSRSAPNNFGGNNGGSNNQAVLKNSGFLLDTPNSRVESSRYGPSDSQYNSAQQQHPHHQHQQQQQQHGPLYSYRVPPVRLRRSPLEEYLFSVVKQGMAPSNDSTANSMSSGGSFVKSKPNSTSPTPTTGVNNPTSSSSGQYPKSPSKLAQQSMSYSYSPSGSSIVRKPQISSSGDESPDTLDWDQLDLYGMSLSTISPAILLYNNIGFLQIHNNRFSTIPLEICAMTNLRVINASNNMISWIPPEIGNLIYLRELILENNQITVLPIELAKLYRLYKLSVSGNPIQNIPMEILQLGTHEILDHLREMFSPPDPPPPRSWTLNAYVDRLFSVPGYFANLESTLGPKSVQVLENGHKVVSVQAQDAGQFRIEGSIRVMCYNILAEVYAHGLTCCPLWALSWGHRSHLVMKEIDMYSPDIVCLQEVEYGQFYNLFKPELESRGYLSSYLPKTRFHYATDKNRVDGCAIFYRQDTFEMVESFQIEFQEIVRANPERYKSALDETGFARLLSKDNIALGMVLKRIDKPFPPPSASRTVPSKHSGSSWPPGKGARHSRGSSNHGSNVTHNSPDEFSDNIIIVNTHIHWDPEFSDVKLMQTQILLEQLEECVSQYSSPTFRIPLILGGDFNSKPDSAVYTLLNEGFVKGDHDDFQGYNYGNYTQNGLSHSLKLRSGMNALVGEPRFTNYTVDFSGVLDYIWYSQDGFSVERSLNGIDETLATIYNGALPNPHMPSDHIPLVVDFIQNSRKE